MKRDLGAAAACGGLYWLNRLWLRTVTGGWVQWFLVCYFSDVLAGLVWECVAPLWKAGAVFDPWDVLAYQAGGALYLLQKRLCMGKEKSS